MSEMNADKVKQGLGALTANDCLETFGLKVSVSLSSYERMTARIRLLEDALACIDAELLGEVADWIDGKRLRLPARAEEKLRTLAAKMREVKAKIQPEEK